MSATRTSDPVEALEQQAASIERAISLLQEQLAKQQAAVLDSPEWQVTWRHVGMTEYAAEISREIIEALTR